MTSESALPRRPRGRPSKNGQDYADTRAVLLRRGIEMLTMQGISPTALNEILKSSGIPKGSFYHYFKSKDAFIAEALDAYADYFARKLTRHFSNSALSPLARLGAFVDDACVGMQRFEFSRGCLVGNLGQEISSLDEPLRQRVEDIFRDWECRLQVCLSEAIQSGELPAQTDCVAMAHVFWVGWEGAVLRARLRQDLQPMRAFHALFLAALSKA